MLEGLVCVFGIVFDCVVIVVFVIGLLYCYSGMFVILFGYGCDDVVVFGVIGFVGKIIMLMWVEIVDLVLGINCKYVWIVIY